MRARSFTMFTLCLALSLTACGDDAPESRTDPDAHVAEPDASAPTPPPVDPDASIPRTPPPVALPERTPVPGCDAPVMLAGELGAVTLDFDTRWGVAGTLPLSEDCDHDTGQDRERAPELIVAYRVPGEGPMGIAFTLDSEATDFFFDASIEIRRTCETASTGPTFARCFDDFHGFGVTVPAGGLTATGGDTVYLAIRGYTTDLGGDVPYVPGGRGRLIVTAAVNAAPVLESATTRLTGIPGSAQDTVAIMVRGTDADANAQGLLITFIDRDGAPIDFSNSYDGLTVTSSVQLEAFVGSTNERAEASFMLEARASSVVPTLVALGATRVRVRIVDHAFGVSNEIVAPIEGL